MAKLTARGHHCVFRASQDFNASNNDGTTRFHRAYRSDGKVLKRMSIHDSAFNSSGTWSLCPNTWNLSDAAEIKQTLKNAGWKVKEG